MACDDPGPRPPSEVEVHWLDLDAQDAGALSGLLVDDERHRVARLATDELRRRATVRLAARRLVVSGALCVEPGSLVLGADDRGRPLVAAPRVDGLDVSFSSSGRLACVAVARGTRVGVDVEELAPLRNAPRLTERIATRAEADALRGVTEDAREVAVLRLWSRKEAYLKATGEGIAAGLRTTELGVADATTWRRIRPDPHGAPWLVVDLECPIGEAAAALVAAPRDDGSPPALRVS